MLQTQSVAPALLELLVQYHPFQWLNPSLCYKSFRLASLEDIAAMKLHAIINSGERPKDFVDLAFLSLYFSYNKMKELLMLKYPSFDPIMADRSITYFSDIKTSLIEEIKMIGYDLDFELIVQRLASMTDSPDKVFKQVPLTKSKK